MDVVVHTLADPLRFWGILDDDVGNVGGLESRDAWARDIVASEARRLWGRNATLAERQTIQAIGRFEGGYGFATKPAAWIGSNNWGAVQCKHGPPCGNDCFETQDSHADKSKYQWCYRKYPTPEAGAADVVRLVSTARPHTFEALRSGSALAVASAMRSEKYFEASVGFYATAIANNVKAIATTLGEPLAVTLDGKGVEASNNDSSQWWGGMLLACGLPIAFSIIRARSAA